MCFVVYKPEIRNKAEKRIVTFFPEAGSEREQFGNFAPFQFYNFTPHISLLASKCQTFVYRRFYIFV